MPTKSRKTKKLDHAQVEFLISKYSSFREEIQHRDTNNYQLITLHMTIAAAILTFGLRPESPASVLFIIPITSALLCFLATHNLLVRGRLKMAIRREIESKFNFVSEELASQKSFVINFLGVVGAAGIFMAVQMLAFILGLIKIQEYTTLDMVLIISDILALFITLWLIYIVFNARRKTEESPVY